MQTHGFGSISTAAQDRPKNPGSSQKVDPATAFEFLCVEFVTIHDMISCTYCMNVAIGLDLVIHKGMTEGVAMPTIIAVIFFHPPI